MNRVGIRELSQHAGQIIEAVVASGEPVLITNHGRPAVALVPVREVVQLRPEVLHRLSEADMELAQGQTYAGADALASTDALAAGD